MLDSIAYQDGTWLPRRSLSWSPWDVGPMVGAIAVERLRTFQGRPHALDLHLKRLMTTSGGLRCNTLLSETDWRGLVFDLLHRNQDVLAGAYDASIVILMSPGLSSPSGPPTAMMYLDPLPWQQLADRYRDGIAVSLTTVENVPTTCWPAQWKVRSRLQYYLADRQAQELHPGSIALLPDIHRFVTDTSIAYPIFRVDGHWIGPSLEKVLPSVTAQFFADDLQERFHLRFDELAVDRLTDVTEMMLMGSTGQLHAVSSLNLSTIRSDTLKLPGVDGNGYRTLKAAMEHKLGFAFSAQPAAVLQNSVS